ncbi:MAG: 8-amino-7-oxononanoate synthase, partial [Clostridiales bacterium]|nr:8-amino-7-oxononanoate synthase [Clostridiales bacterium]
MDIFEKAQHEQIYDIAQKAGIYPYFHELESGQDTQVIMEGKETIMIGSNNYLGLTSEPSVVEAGVKALEKYGSGCS